MVYGGLDTPWVRSPVAPGEEIIQMALEAKTTLCYSQQILIHIISKCIVFTWSSVRFDRARILFSRWNLLDFGILQTRHFLHPPSPPTQTGTAPPPCTWRQVIDGQSGNCCQQALASTFSSWDFYRKQTSSGRGRISSWQWLLLLFAASQRKWADGLVATKEGRVLS